MKENEVDVDQLWVMIITCLKAASDAGTWAFWRERFACTHPNHNIEEINNPTQFAYANFHAAKGLYCHHKEELDRYSALQQNNICTATGFVPRQAEIELFEAMKRVVEEEMVAQLEEQILNSEESTGYWEGDEYLALPESNNVELDQDSY
jgi:hypothetical protein